MKIITDSNIPYIDDYFGACGNLTKHPGRQITKKDVQDADILLVRSVTHVNRTLLKNSRVKFVGSVTAGADHLDTAWLDKVGISWANAAGFNAPPVANYVLSVIAALQRKQVLPLANIKAAVIGVGHVGQLVADYLSLLNIQVTLCDPLRAATEPDFTSYSLDTIADQDIILLHVPLTKSGEHATHHMIDQTFLQRQKPGCVLLNASRGAVINTNDLIEYGRHLFWCFDVWEHEPNIDQQVLERAMIATPHIAGYSLQSKIRGTKMIYDIACARGVIAEQTIPPIQMPHQSLTFAENKCHWQDVVLGAFNPIVMTAMMRTLLLPADNNKAQLFDDMRARFNYRHELAYINVEAGCIVKDEIELVRALGIQVVL